MAEIAPPQQDVAATPADIVSHGSNDDTDELPTSSPGISTEKPVATEPLDLGGRIPSEDEIKEMVVFNTAIRCSAHLNPGLFSWGLEVEVPGLRKKLKLEVGGRLFFMWWQRQFLRGTFFYYNDRPQVGVRLVGKITKPTKLSPLTVEYTQLGRTVGRFVTQDHAWAGELKDTTAYGTASDIDAFQDGANVWDTWATSQDGSGHSHNTGTVFLNTNVEAVDQKVVVGLKRLNIAQGHQTGVTAYAKLPDKHHKFPITLNKDGDNSADLQGGGLSWYFPPLPTETGILVGNWFSGAVTSTGFRKVVKFQDSDNGGRPRPPIFRQPPTVCVWLSGFLHRTTDDNFNLRVRLGNVTNTTFELIISSYGHSRLAWASGSFIAVDRTRSHGVRVGTISANAIDGGNWKTKSQTQNVGVEFGTVIAGFTGLDASNKNGLKVNIDVDQQAADSFKWTAESWGDSTMNASEAMYICY
ncbi:hypothetical protein CGMCC3_g1106 [Colletotrichum fructicola]|uniref:H-type lectin domain-containing protein n=1 Tax=Colletotrichum fructicola (strain Nara gc5) TaxID=1213859 RepID=A0A7J6IWD9_COLFN|nr:uncharacterized protein CGMCC3_g1106 [Colletotrichum fructicola]KAE9582803.1 hypothetical protein CGMCC3_g1106 [Colletotrichum fructicola]KAF4412487.1 hypothetical protein CFRS1_v002561 [Colletotrichum fructicola]KAF4480532.1 hypothetical protein CGGC5_v010873 [Colletotrichum fructicola Nara gc5]KAF4902108.1 hypothetical protein CGCFRS4_v002402 [Colletotrichum fructicola]